MSIKFKLFGREMDVRKTAILAVSVMLLAGAVVTGFVIKERRSYTVFGKAVSADMHDGTSGGAGTGRETDAAADAAADAAEGTGDAGTTAGTTGAGGADYPDGEGASDNGNGAGAGADSSKSGEGIIKVYVVGCVRNKGIVTLKKGQLIDDAIKAAGGPSPDADMENINLVYRLEDNVMLRVLSRNTAKNVSSSAAGGNINSGSGVILIKDSNGAVTGGDAGDSGAAGRININSASQAELDRLPYIGAGTAGDIIAYREKNGPFKRIEDIMKVPGIKESKFSRIKDLIVVN